MFQSSGEKSHDIAEPNTSGNSRCPSWLSAVWEIPCAPPVRGRGAVSGGCARAWPLAGCMSDYYTSDATQMPYSAIFKGNDLPLWIRLLFAFRKAVGWHYTAAHARCAPERWRSLEMGDLHVSARQRLESVIVDIEPHGFNLVGISRSDTIGRQISYNAVLIADDALHSARLQHCGLVGKHFAFRACDRSS